MFGTTVAGRPSEVPDVENVIGLFLNTVPARIAFDPAEPVGTLLRRVQDERLALMPHEWLGLGVVQAETGHRRLFDTLFVMRDGDTRDRLADLRDRYGATAVANVDATHYPVNLIVTPGEPTRVTLAYRPDLVSERYATDLLDRFALIVTRLAADFTAPARPPRPLAAGESTPTRTRTASTSRPTPSPTCWPYRPPRTPTRRRWSTATSPSPTPNSTRGSTASPAC